MNYLTIAGTHSYGESWYKEDDSPFNKFMSNRGHVRLKAKDGRAFKWSTALDGLLGPNHDSWNGGADALYYFLVNVPFEDRNLFAHSHGGQVVFNLASQGFPIRNLITIGTPYRFDIPVDQAEKYIVRHQHIYDDKWDTIQWLGSLGDKKVSNERRFLYSNVINYGLNGISHSKMVRDATYMHLWDDYKILEQAELIPNDFSHLTV